MRLEGEVLENHQTCISLTLIIKTNESKAVLDECGWEPPRYLESLTMNSAPLLHHADNSQSK